LRLKKLLAFALAAVVLAACSQDTGAPASSRHTFTVPHVLRFMTAEDIIGLNPHLAGQTTVSYLSSLTMAWLVKTGPHAEPIPELATVVPTQQNGGISKDGLTITYRLRKDARWSDGVPFTADDVIFSIRTVLNPATNEIGRAGWDLIRTIDRIDKYTVRLHLTKKYSPYAVTFFASAGVNPCVLPQHLLGKLPNINTAAYNALPVGIGPFKYTSWKRGDSVEMVPDPLYFRGAPKLQKVIFKIVPDRNTALTQMTTHEVDMWLSVSAPYFGRLQAIKDIIVARQPGVVYDHLDFNTSHPALTDPRVRRALRYGVDRREIRDKIRHGLGTLSENIFGPNHPAYHLIALVPFNIGAGKKLLDAAGWTPGSDGVRVKNGTRLSLTFVSSSGTPDADQQIELIRANWKKLGVELNVRRYLSPVIFKIPDGIYYGGKFDAFYYAWALDSFGDVSGLFSCRQMPPAGQNALRWCDRRAEAAMDAFVREYDTAKRNKYDYIVSDRIAQDVPTIVMDIRDNIAAYNSDLKNWKPNLTNPFDDMMKVDI
jgi:peptide/nickel transport system substrate-binding protein